MNLMNVLLEKVSLFNCDWIYDHRYKSIKIMINKMSIVCPKKYGLSMNIGAIMRETNPSKHDIHGLIGNNRRARY